VAQDSTKGNIAIKMTNLGAAIAFRCTNWRGSHAILDAPDAVKLYGKGLMYFKCEQHEGLLRVQGSYMEPVEIMGRLDNMEFDHASKDEYIIDGLDEPALQPKFGDIDSENAIPYDVHERKLAEIIIWALSKDWISNNQIKKKFEMGYDTANKFLDELEAFGLVAKLREGTKLSRAVIPEQIEDIPTEVAGLLAKHGYTEDDIKNALNPKASQAANQDESSEPDAQAGPEN
jgi:DNA segregation ATPase FtsK/SpoIIIE-like protein